MTATPRSSGSRPATGVLFRPAAERFHSQLDWLDSWHTFSFASHVDPAWMGFGPLRVINDDTIAAGRGFGMHPHRDMEIITVMVEGDLHHHDSMGHSSVLRAGEVQRMSSGSGIVHSERNEGDRPCRLLQIWIEPDAVGRPPAYEQKPFPRGEGWTALIDPDATGGAMAIQRPARLWRGRAAAGQLLSPPAPADRFSWIQMITGDLSLAFASDDASPAGEAMALTGGDGLGVARGPGSPSIQALTAGPRGADWLWFALS